MIPASGPVNWQLVGGYAAVMAAAATVVPVATATSLAVGVAATARAAQAVPVATVVALAGAPRMTRGDWLSGAAQGLGLARDSALRLRLLLAPRHCHLETLVTREARHALLSARDPAYRAQMHARCWLWQ